FYFNVKGASLSKLDVALPNKPGHLPYLHFLAAPLLPCGEADSGLHEFTGNESLGQLSPQKPLEMAIHAFSHVVYKYTRGHMFLCDLQGEF
ncbi:hypothetical protein C8Q80DRAFT_1078849, partial [Daedaleopsis nitida]